MRYWVFKDSQILGPISREEVQHLKGLGPDVMVCPEGADGLKETDWVVADSVPEFMGAFPAGEPAPLTAEPALFDTPLGLGLIAGGAPLEADRPAAEAGRWDSFLDVLASREDRVRGEKRQAFELEAKVEALNKQLQRYEERLNAVLDRLNTKDRAIVEKDALIRELRQRLGEPPGKPGAADAQDRAGAPAGKGPAAMPPEGAGELSGLPRWLLPDASSEDLPAGGDFDVPLSGARQREPDTAPSSADALEPGGQDFVPPPPREAGPAFETREAGPGFDAPVEPAAAAFDVPAAPAPDAMPAPGHDIQIPEPAPDVQASAPVFQAMAPMEAVGSAPAEAAPAAPAQPAWGVPIPLSPPAAPPSGRTPVPIPQPDSAGQAAMPLDIGSDDAAQQPSQPAGPPPRTMIYSAGSMPRPDSPPAAPSLGLSVMTPVPGALKPRGPGGSPATADRRLDQVLDRHGTGVEAQPAAAPSPMAELKGKAAEAGQAATPVPAKRSRRSMVFLAILGAAFVVLLAVALLFLRNPKEVARFVSMGSSQRTVPDPEDMLGGGPPGQPGGQAQPGQQASPFPPRQPGGQAAPVQTQTPAAQPAPVAQLPAGTAPPAQPPAAPAQPVQAPGRDFIATDAPKAIELVKGFKLGRGRGTIEKSLLKSHPVPANEGEWSVNPGKEAGVYFVNFKAYKGRKAAGAEPAATYVFEANLADKSVSGVNPAAKALLAGRTAAGKGPAKPTRKRRPRPPATPEDVPLLPLPGEGDAGGGGFNNPGGAEPSAEPGPDGGGEAGGGAEAEGAGEGG